jgi:hypothetical protein
MWFKEVIFIIPFIHCKDLVTWFMQPLLPSLFSAVKTLDFFILTFLISARSLVNK